ncbi:cytochrome P450 [Aspergillus carlsbadensis]|nr:cytochrome P450 [Aspergillus carlsbadensis]
MGPVVRTGPHHVSVADPGAIKTIYGINSKCLKADFYKPFGARFDGARFDNLFSTRDPVEHKHLKVSVSQKFSMTSIRQFEPMADECCAMFLAAMRELQGQKMDLGVWVQWYAFDVIAAMTFQARFGFMETRTDVDGMISSIEKALMYGSIIGQIPKLHAQISLREMRRYETDGEKSSRTDFLALTRADAAAEKHKLSDREVLNHLSNNLLAGSDTTAISLRAVFYYLLQHPSVYRNLVDEIMAADRKGKLSEYITYGECVQLPYLQAVMKEAMRLHPGIQIPLERVVPKGGTQIAGKYLPEGTVVGINPIVIHLNLEVYGPDAAEFRPERWLDADEEQLKIMDRSFLAFGHGSRTCIGKNISIMEMGKFVPQILREFDFEWASNPKDWRVHTYWFAKQEGLVVRLMPRRLATE